MGVRSAKEAVKMRCLACKKGQTSHQTINMELEWRGFVFEFSGVPAEVCGTCGEEYLSADVSKHLDEIMEREARKAGISVMAPPKLKPVSRLAFA